MLIKPIGKGYMVGHDYLLPVPADVALAEYLLGYDTPPTGRLLQVQRSGWSDRIPILNPILRRYLAEVYRFLFAGGLKCEVPGAKYDDPSNVFLRYMVQDVGLNALLPYIWERGAITGQVALCFQIAGNLDEENPEQRNPIPRYLLDIFDCTEYMVALDANGDVEQLNVLTTRQNLDGEDCWLKRTYTKAAYITYPLVPCKDRHTDWGAIATVTPHNYPFVPVQLINNTFQGRGSEGRCEFNQTALDIATEVAIATLDNASNHHFFANPIYVSPDPRETLKALQQRVSVLQKEPATDGGAPELLQPVAMPPSHFELMKQLETNFAHSMGISYVSDIPQAETSSLTLRLLNARTIAKAQSKWDLYVGYGLQKLLSKMMLAAGADGILVSIDANVPGTYEVGINHQTSFFPMSPLERYNIVQVVQGLVEIGIKPEVALQEYYQEASLQDIAAKLAGQ